MWQVFPCSNFSDCLSHAQARTVTWLHVPQEKTSVPIVVKVPSGRQSKWLLGKPFLAKIPILDTEPSLHVQELLAPAYSSRSAAGETDVRWTWFQTVPFPEVLAQSLHLQERMLTVCQQCLLWFLKKMYYIIHMASLSLFECSDCLLHAQARTVTWLHVPQEKTSVPIVVKVPSGRQSKWLLGKPFLAKIFWTLSQELLAPPYSSP